MMQRKMEVILVMIRQEADKHYRTNAERIQLKYSEAKNKKVLTFCPGDYVSVRIPRIDRSSTDSYRLPCVVVERYGSKFYLYRVRCKYGVLKDCYGEGDMELYQGDLSIPVDGWKDASILSLRQAALKFNPHNVFHYGICNCKSKCNTKRCSCVNRGSPCSSKCHGGKHCDNCYTEEAGVIEGVSKKRKICDSQKNMEVLTVSSDSEDEYPTYKKGDISELNLKAEDIHDIEAGKWLSDNHMRAAQQLLTKQFPNRSGLQDTLKSQNLSWELMIPGQVQLLHDGGLHWICVSTIDCPPDSIKVYDSLEFPITAYLKKQLAALIKPKSTHLTILVIKQKGSSDCGVFAIAHAMLLCSSMNSLICQFDQTSIRNHLVQCFLKQKL